MLDLYFRVPDDANIMQDPEASNPVVRHEISQTLSQLFICFKLLIYRLIAYLQNVLIGMDLPLLENKQLSVPDSHISDDSGDDISYFEDYYEVTSQSHYDYATGFIHDFV